MKLKLFLFVTLILNLCAGNTYAAAKLFWKTEIEFAKPANTTVECKAKDSACLDANIVSHADLSHYGRTFYVTFEQASRAYISFDAPRDRNPNVQLELAIEQFTNGAVDWGGVMVGKKFKPLYAIHRIYHPGFDYAKETIDKSKSGLLIWRLSPEPGVGKSEVLSFKGAENLKAREFAKKDFALRQKSK